MKRKVKREGQKRGQNVFTEYVPKRHHTCPSVSLFRGINDQKPRKELKNLTPSSNSTTPVVKKKSCHVMKRPRHLRQTQALRCSDETASKASHSEDFCSSTQQKSNSDSAGSHQPDIVSS